MPKPVKYDGGYYVNFGDHRSGTRVRKRFSRNKYTKPYQAALEFIESYTNDLNSIKTSITNAIDEYIRNMELTGKKKASTILVDSRRLNIFKKWCDENNLTMLDHITKLEVYKFQEYYLNNAPFYNTTNGQRKNYNPRSTWNKYFFVISALIRWSVSRDMIDKEMILSHKEFYLKPNEVFERWFTPDERDTLIEYFKDTGDVKLHCFFRLLAFSGVRAGEAINLTWDKIDFLNNRLLIDKYTKSSKRRSIGIHKLKLLPYLKEIKSKNKYVFDNGKNDKYISRDAYYKRLQTATKKCNIEPGGLKAFRHCFGSVMAMNGAHPKEIMEAMGHASIETSNIYMHLAPTSLDDRINTL